MNVVTLKYFKIQGIDQMKKDTSIKLNDSSTKELTHKDAQITIQDIYNKIVESRR